MNITFTQIIYVYLAVISVVAVIATISDKIKAKRHSWRIPENTLLLISVLGGSVAMYVTMLLIRHKTKHPKFMLGIPFIIFGQLAIIYWLIHIGFISLP